VTARRIGIFDAVRIVVRRSGSSNKRRRWVGVRRGRANHERELVPTAVSVFPDELFPAPRSWAERAYPKLIHFNKLPKGGHFAAWEQPKLFSEEVRAGFRSLRT
jgi:pimeloyl-ACP methyl ester carboxylesterase